MTCQHSIEMMMDVLYGEEVGPRQCFEFFEHLAQCSKCNQEYAELVETREMLSEWESEGMVSEVVAIPTPEVNYPDRKASAGWWPLLQKVAAGVLIVFGAYSLVQSTGLLPEKGTVTVSEARLAEVIHDMTLARQVEDWREIGKALLAMQEGLEARNRLQVQAVYEDMQNLEQRYVYALEESNRQVKTLISQ